MLSDTDIHYLVGLLTQVSEAEDVSIELGDMVYDASADEERDIDITVTTLNGDGTRSEYKGIEVKDHSRPMDVAQVEQLCIKFMDTPEITYRAIVSASGYTKNSLKKAEAHNVDLLEIVDWKNPTEGFRVKFDRRIFKITEDSFEWAEQPNVRVNVAEKDLTADLEEDVRGNPPISTSDGKGYPDVPNLDTLNRNIATTALRQAQAQEENITPPQTTNPKDVTVHITVDKTPYLNVSSRLVPIENFVVTGKVRHIAVTHEPTFKILRRVREEHPISGCAIFQMSNGNLMGMSVNNSNNDVHALNIPYEDRVKKKIKQHHIPPRSSKIDSAKGTGRTDIIS